MKIVYFIGGAVFSAILFVVLGDFHSEKKNSNRLIFPVYNECKSYFEDLLEAGQDLTNDLRFKWQEFPIKTAMFENISYYLEIESSKYNQTELLNSLTEGRNNCFPNSYLIIDALSSESLSELNEIIQMNRKMGVDRQYIVISDNKIRIYFYEPFNSKVTE